MYTLNEQMNTIFEKGLNLIQLHKDEILEEWNTVTARLNLTRDRSPKNIEDTIQYFSNRLFSSDESTSKSLTLSFQTNKFIITLLENAVHKVIQQNKEFSHKHHQAIQYVFIKLSEEVLTQPYQQYFAIDTFLQNLVSSNQLPIIWTAIALKRNHQFVAEKWFNHLSQDLLHGNDHVKSNTIYGLSELLLDQMSLEEKQKYTVFPIPYEDITILICVHKEDSTHVVPFVSYALQVFQNGKESFQVTKQDQQWKDSVIMFNETVLRSRNYREAVENITAGFVNYLPFERCALFSYSIDEQMGFGLFGHHLDNTAIQNITEDISNLPIIQNNLQILELFGKSLDYLQPIYIKDAEIGFPSQYIQQFNLRSVIIAPIFLASNNKLLGAAILDQGPGKYFKVGQEIFSALIKFGQSAGEILAKFSNEREAKSPTDEVNLSPREIEVLQLMAEGCSTTEAASSLNLSEYTVRDYVSAIMQKMDARNRTEAVARALREGMIE
ncbi:response regulator transcription factor [Ornithinibacillus californiensis]|uniref:response regulator transcription factor n=1 Tax=Ornithinibacillus californiensis TaxID=161536 RepID=UPI00064DEA09|nr:response regulator transcription factor [Ornithinibacillus californiensis]